MLMDELSQEGACSPPWKVSLVYLGTMKEVL